jgi:hypothetical protein
VLGVAHEELRNRIDQLRREVGPPWAQDQKLAALAAWIALARRLDPTAEGRAANSHPPRRA